MDIHNFRIGDRVQLHPATDTWMRGDRYGTIVSIRNSILRVHMDISRKDIAVTPNNILEIISSAEK